MKSYEEILAAMEDAYRELAGFDADDASDIGIRLKVLAQQVHLLYGQAQGLQAQVFPGTSSGAYLDMHAETRNIRRKPALAAQGVLRFSREAPAQGDIAIEAGTVCATPPDPQLLFGTAQAGVLAQGETFVDIPAQAIDAGNSGNVAAGAVTRMVTCPPGISAVTNPQPFYGGVEEESDGALRQRLLLSYKNISNGTNSAFYYEAAMEQEGVLSANVLPRLRGRGTVDVVVACAPGRREEAVAVLQALLDRQKEINVDVLVRAAGELPVDMELALETDGEYDFPAVADALREAAALAVDGLGVGEPLLLARLGRALLEVPGVYNYQILEPARDIRPTGEQVLCCGGITVARLED